MDDLPPFLPQDSSAAVSARFAPLVKAEGGLEGGIPLPKPARPPSLPAPLVKAEGGPEGRVPLPTPALPPSLPASEMDTPLLPAPSQTQKKEERPSLPPSLPPQTKKKRRWKGLTITLLLFRLARGGVVVQALWQAIGSLAVFIAPLALRRIVDFVSHHGEEGRG